MKCQCFVLLEQVWQPLAHIEDIEGLSALRGTRAMDRLRSSRHTLHIPATPLILIY